MPQGSVLGPKLFSIYVNDLPEAPSCCNLEMFADDTTLYCVGSSVDEVTINLQSALSEIAVWCKRNYLTIHPDKLEVMLMKSKEFIGPLKPIKLAEQNRNYVTTSKCLGFKIDHRLTWEHHITDLTTNMSNKLKQLRRFKSLPSQILETIYFKGIVPSVTYGIGVWGSCSEAKIERIERIHQRAARIILKVPQGKDQKQPTVVRRNGSRSSICTRKGYYA